MVQPKIGLTLDYQEEKTYSKYPWYALRENYAGCIRHFGAVPIPLVPSVDLVDVYLDTIDGLVVTGGFFDVGPEHYGKTAESESVKPVPTRTKFELSLIKRALDRDMPVLGICGGEQVLNVALGGTLVQHIPDVFPRALAHEQPNPRHEVGHAVEIVSGTLLERITGEQKIMVNSAHHQAVERPGYGVVVNAYAPDGVIEGIEVLAARFCLGVQWHPEFFITDYDKKVIQALVNAC